MANYLTTDTELTSIANAIRTKGGTSSSLTYPAGFVSAINSISSGTNWSEIAEPLKSAKHIYSGVVIDSPEAFEKAVNIQLANNTYIQASTATVGIRFSTTSTGYLQSYRFVASTSSYTYPSSIASKLITVRLSAWQTGSITYVITGYPGSSSIAYTAYKYNLSSSSMKLSSNLNYIYLSLYYNVEYNPYSLNGVQWFHGLNNEIYFQCLNYSAAIASTTDMSSKYWGAASASTVIFTSDTTSIPGNAFIRHKTIYSIEGISHIQSIGRCAFWQCENLTGSINLTSCTTISASAFASCYNISNVYLPNCQFVDGAAFYSCGLTYATSQNFPALTSIAQYAFQGCNNLSMVSLSSVSTIGSATFYGCSGLIDVSLPLITSIPLSAFAGCTKLKNVYVPSCSAVYANGFSNCIELSELVLNNCAIIYSSAFKGCSSLFDLYLLSTSMVSLSGGNTAFASTPLAFNSSTSGKIHVPSNLLSDYLADPVWSAYSGHLVGIE